MENSGKELENFVGYIENILLPKGFTVSPREKIFDKDGNQIAELDLVISGTLSTTQFHWLIECRDRPSEGKAPISWIEQLFARRDRLNFNKVTAVSTTGFSSAAITYAQEKGIELRAIKEITREEIEDWFLVEEMNVHLIIRDLKNSDINIIGVIDEEQKKELSEIFKNLKTTDFIFVHTGSGNKFNIQQIWDDVLKQVPLSDNDMVSSADIIRKTLTVNYTNSESRFKLILKNTDLHIDNIIFTYNVSVKNSKVPISKITRYGDITESQSIAESIRFDVPAKEGNIGVSIHRLVSGDETYLTVTRSDIE